MNQHDTTSINLFTPMIPPFVRHSFYVAVAFLLFQALAVHGQTQPQQIKESLAARQPQIEAGLRAGKFAEMLSGILGAAKTLTPDEQSILDEENRDRTALHQWLADQQQLGGPDGARRKGEERHLRYVDRLAPGIAREIIDASGQRRLWDGRDPDPRTSGVPVRIVTMDGAAIHQEPRSDSMVVEGNLPRFSAYSVIQQQDGWYQVTHRSPDQVLSLGTSPLGWISADKCAPWNHSIVVSPNPLIGRERARFVKNKKILNEIAASTAIEERKSRMAGLPAGADGYIAEEPFIDYATQTKAFVMPVISFEEISVDNRPVNLLEISSPLHDPGGKARVPELDVVFAMDTTGSMGPYTDRVKLQITAIAERFATETPNVRFGFVAYRDAVAKDPQMDYLIKNFTPELLSIDAFRNSIAAVESVSKPLRDEIPEAMFDGVRAAIDSKWRPIKDCMRLVIVIGDAPSHEKMQDGRSGGNLRELAATNKVNLSAIFLKNGKNSKKETDGNAIAQLTQLTRSNERGTAGEEGKPLLQIIDAQNIESFGQSFSKIFDRITAFIKDPKAIEKVSDDAPVEEHAIDLLLRNAYLEWVRSSNDAEPPPGFIRGWTADKLLYDSSHPVFTPKVLLSRLQLQGLNHIMTSILESNRDKDSWMELLDRVRGISAVSIINPDLLKDADSLTLGELFKLPVDLAVLPYKSRLTKISKEEWEMTAQGQQESEEKTRWTQCRDWYTELLEDKRIESRDDPSPNWKPLATGANPDDYVCLVPIHMLP
jgi:serine/threonine-protein kinase PpkA